MYFLLVYNRREGRLLEQRSYEDHERERAIQERFSLERDERMNPDIEVVLLSAESREELKKTHSRYFEQWGYFEGILERREIETLINSAKIIEKIFSVSKPGPAGEKLRRRYDETLRQLVRALQTELDGARVDSTVSRERRLLMRVALNRLLLAAQLGPDDQEKAAAVEDALNHADAALSRSVLDANHPSMPIAAAEDAFRLVCTFTPRATELQLSVSRIHDVVRGAAIDLLKINRDQWQHTPQVPITVSDDGWVSVDTDSVRLAMSVEGQVRCSIRHVRTSGRAQINPDAEFWSIAHDLYDFLHTVEHLYGALGRSVSGVVSFELREINGWQIYFHAKELLRKDDDTNAGIADKDEIFSGNVSWTVGKNSARVAADCMGELALQFKSGKGNRVRFDHEALAKHLEPGK